MATESSMVHKVMEVLAVRDRDQFNNFRCSLFGTEIMQMQFIVGVLNWNMGEKLKSARDMT